MHAIRHFRPKLILAAVIWIALIVAACSPQTAINEPLDLPETYEVADDFGHSNPAWMRFETDYGSVGLYAGELFIEDRGQGKAVMTSLVGKSYVDATVDVQLRHVQGSVNNWMGVLCRMQGEGTYYLLAISADGYYLVLQVVDNLATPLIGPAASEVINVGKAQNQLRVRCQQNRLSLWVNGTHITTQLSDAIAGAGKVGLLADAVDPGGTTVTAFDNFILTAP